MRIRLTVGLTTLVAIGLVGCRSSSDPSDSAATTDVAPTSPVEDVVDEHAEVDGLVLDVEVAMSADDVAAAPTSDDQSSTLDRLGRPDRFVLRLDDGIRQESWYYDDIGFEVAFRDGVRLYAEPVRARPIDGLGTTLYSPQRFTMGMSIEELLAVTGERGYAEQPIDLVDGRLIVVRGIVAGFDQDGLRYLETVPIDLG